MTASRCRPATPALAPPVAPRLQRSLETLRCRWRRVSPPHLWVFDDGWNGRRKERAILKVLCEPCAL
jgi:hypothetical protein